MSSSGDHKDPGTRSGDRVWQARPVLSWLLRAALFLLPIVASVVVGWAAAALMPRPSGPWSMLAWWLVFIAALTVPAMSCLRLTRRILPMAALLKLTLVFPDKAPTRLDVAKRAGRTRDLKKRLADGSTEDDATESAALVLALITSLGEHDRRTRGHSERVRAFTDMLGEQLKLTRDEREKLRWAALLHDIGKLEVSTDILNKPAKPTEEEWAILKSHPIKGTAILGPLAAWLGPWSGAVTEHHEKWDGSGYPRQLAGENISLGGRILAIADSYEVMTAARAYKKPMTAEAARAELTRCSGTHFDPRLVREFLEISVGRLWFIIGLGAVLAQLPVLSGLSYRGLTERFGRSVATAAGAVGAAGVLMFGGAIDPPSSLPGSRPELVAVTSGQQGSGGTEGGDRSTGGGGPGQQDRDPNEDGGGSGGTGGAESGSGPVAAPDPAQPVSPGVGGGGGGSPGGGGRPDEKVTRVVEEGAVAAVAPLDPTVAGVTETEFLSGCAEPSSQGFDAYVFEVPPADEATVSEVSIEPTAGGDTGNVRAYSDDCEPVGFLPVARAVPLPDDASWIVVIPTRGLGTTVTLELILRR